MHAILTLAEHPEYIDRAAALNASIWDQRLPPCRSAHLYPRILAEFPEQVLMAVDPASDTLVALAGGLPLRGPDRLEDLPEDGYDGAIQQAFQTRDRGLRPNLFSALAITVAAEHQGQGLSGMMVQALKQQAGRQGLDRLVVPVRPTWKAREPFTAMADYLRKRRPDGLWHDPWLRLHQRLGARFVKICPESMTRRAPVAAWVEALDRGFPESGAYAIPGALSPLIIDLEQDQGLLVEPNVWMGYGAAV